MNSNPFILACSISLISTFLLGLACQPAAPDDPAKDDATSQEDATTKVDGTDEAKLRCSADSLVWKSGTKTEYESYPEPGSVECTEFNGCAYLGLFAACSEKRSEQWVKDHNIVAVFPDFGDLELHDVCLRYGDTYFVATVLDTCADSDCSGCCTRNQGKADQLIDLEKYTAQRWGIPETAAIEWADLGPTAGKGCE